MSATRETGTSGKTLAAGAKSGGKAARQRRRRQRRAAARKRRAAGQAAAEQAALAAPGLPTAPASAGTSVLAAAESADGDEECKGGGGTGSSAAGCRSSLGDVWGGPWGLFLMSVWLILPCHLKRLSFALGLLRSTSAWTDTLPRCTGLTTMGQSTLTNAWNV